MKPEIQVVKIPNVLWMHFDKGHFTETFTLNLNEAFALKYALDKAILQMISNVPEKEDK